MSDIITKEIRPLTAGERLRIYLERREAALSAGHGSDCVRVVVPVELPITKAPTFQNAISLFLRGAA